MWTDEQLNKLAFLEKSTIKYLDDFIGDGIQIRKIVDHVSLVREHILRDYIGRTEDHLTDFIRARPHLWTLNREGLVEKVSSRIRLVLRESAIYANDRRGSMEKGRANIDDLISAISAKSSMESWSVDGVKAILQMHPLFFKDVDESDTIFECRVSTVDGVIMPKSLFSPDNADWINDILADASGADRGSMQNASEESTTGGHGGHGGTNSSTIEGYGHVISVHHDHLFVLVSEKKVFCHINQFEKPVPTVHVGDQLYVCAFMFQGMGSNAGKWRASYACRASSSDHRRRSNSPPIARSTEPNRNAGAVDDAQGASTSSAAARESDRSVRDRALLMDKHEIEMVEQQPTQEEYRKNMGIQTEVTDEERLLRLLHVDYVDAAVQTEVTDEERLLRLLHVDYVDAAVQTDGTFEELLRRFPQMSEWKLKQE